MENNSIENSEVRKSKFGEEIDSFIRHIESQADIVPLVMDLVSTKLIQEARLVDKFIKTNRIEEGEKDDEKKLLIPDDKFKEFLELNEKVETTALAHRLLPLNFVVSFVSQFDAYLGRIIRTMFEAIPELLNNTEKTIQLSNLLEFKNIEEAKDFVIEKEVESVLRDSHLKQFKWLEGKLGITLRTDLPSFSDFIEVTERRNLFVHCNGVVSRQYIEICQENNVSGLEKIEIGQKLNADPRYYQKCYSVLFEIGVKLGQVIWRKLKPNELEAADAHLNNVCYELLIKGHFKLALNLLSFATDSLKKHCDKEVEYIFTINKALAHYLSDKKDKAVEILKGEDWSATSDKFKLAIAVLKEDFNDAIELMKSIGPNNKHLNKDAYREWPLFKTFRKRVDFKEIYEDIFGEELIYIENKPRNLEDVLDEMKRMKRDVKKEKETANQL